MRLLLACARLTLAPEERDRVRELARADLDWAAVFRLAAWHGLRPLLRRHLEAVATPALRPVLVELWAETEEIARHNRALATELDAIRAHLAAAGICCVPFKGPTLANEVYGDVGLREFGDLDILLRRDEVVDARECLVARGYRPEYPLAPAAEAAFLGSAAQYHLVLRHGETGLLVELHWRSDRDFPVERDDPAWWSAAARDGVSREDLLILLCVHGTKHYWRSLGWLVDVAELVRCGGEDLDWEAVTTRARELGCGLRLGVGLRLARELLDVPLPPPAVPVAGAVGVEALAHRLEAWALDSGALSLTPWSALRLDMACCEGARQRLRVVGWSLFAPSLVEWSRWPLPRALAFLYPPLRVGRLAAKYGRRALRGG